MDRLTVGCNLDVSYSFSIRRPAHREDEDIPETTLVRAQRRVELHTVTPVDGDRAIVALPSDAELDDALGDLHHGERLAVLGVLLEEGLEGRGDLVHGLSSARDHTSGDGAHLLELGLGGEVGSLLDHLVCVLFCFVWRWWRECMEQNVARRPLALFIPHSPTSMPTRTSTSFSGPAWKKQATGQSHRTACFPTSAEDGPSAAAPSRIP